MTIGNLIIIAGTGNKSGKTTMACRLIGQFRHLDVVSVKITPHFHETTPGLVLLYEGKDYSVFEETNQDLGKDTSRMLRAGASRVFFAKTTDSSVLQAFERIYAMVSPGTPIICESPALRLFAEPGILIIMTSADDYNRKDISRLLALPHVNFDLETLGKTPVLPFTFTGGRWDTGPDMS
jgi:hypothetical protein